MKNFKINVYADGADLNGILDITKNPLVKGITTNPTLMRKSGVEDYKKFALEVLSHVKDLPVSFEVFADTLEEMETQAREIATWGENVNIKIPITNTQGISTIPIIEKLAKDGVKLNVTAMFTLEQVKDVLAVIDESADVILSIFAGRIADAGIDPVPVMRKAVELSASKPNVKILWASPRELLNLIQGDECGCHIITMTNDLIAKTKNIGKDLNQFSLETVQMFFNDAQLSKYTI